MVLGGILAPLHITCISGDTPYKEPSVDIRLQGIGSATNPIFFCFIFRAPSRGLIGESCNLLCVLSVDLYFITPQIGDVPWFINCKINDMPVLYLGVQDMGPSPVYPLTFFQKRQQGLTGTKGAAFSPGSHKGDLGT